MEELVNIKTETHPSRFSSSLIAMTGQDAVRSPKNFTARRNHGVILTKMDGDARGGAALSIKQVTGSR
jgi:signal recognition particle subunit SRP54